MESKDSTQQGTPYHTIMRVRLFFFFESQRVHTLCSFHGTTTILPFLDTE